MISNDAPPCARFAVRGALAIGGYLQDGAIIIEDGVIAGITRSNRDGDLPDRIIDAEIVSPGFIDLQVNGAIGHDVGTNPAALAQIESWLPSTGVTSYLPTVISSPYELYEALLHSWVSESDERSTRRLGIHLEGPFLSPARKGAHPLSAIESADDRLFDLIMESFDVALVTLAPERPGSHARIRNLCEAEVVVSLGHTDASDAELRSGIDAGATMATHLYNAMSPFNHREPGTIGAVLTDDRVTAGLIADGVHAHRSAIDLAVRAKGVEHIALVTDMMSAAGMPPGDYTIGAQHVSTDGTSVRLPDGTLAGSVVRMDEAIRNVVNWTSLSPAQVIRMATDVPARVLGRDDVGSLQSGMFADLVLLDRDLNVLQTLIEGEIVFIHDQPSENG